MILGTEKLIFNKMQINGTDKRLYSINLNTGGVINGITPDGRSVIQRAREEGTWVGCLIKGFGKMEIPDTQLRRLEEKHSVKATRIVGG